MLLSWAFGEVTQVVGDEMERISEPRGAEEWTLPDAVPPSRAPVHHQKSICRSENPHRV